MVQCDCTVADLLSAIDISLTVYTMDYHGPERDSMSSFHSFNSYDNVSGGLSVAHVVC